MGKQYVFGPVASRRLGISLGVDIVRGHRCSLDCIYCEAGKTRELTTMRSSYVPLEELKAELTEVLSTQQELDYITFSGTGEPTLNSNLIEICRWLKEHWQQYKLCLLTNGTLLNDPQVRAALEYVDMAMPSFDASNDEELQIINRPAAGITVESLAEGIRLAAAEYPGKLVLELFVVPQVNDSIESIGRFVEHIKTFRGLRSIQLNTLDRPGVVDWIKPADRASLNAFVAALEPYFPVECIGRYRRRSAALCKKIPPGKFDSAILELAQVRPVTASDMATALNVPEELVAQRAEELVSAGLLSAEKMERAVFYCCNCS